MTQDETSMTEALSQEAAANLLPSPTYGSLVDLSPEEVVIKPQPLASKDAIDVHIHFPRLGFVVRPHMAPNL